MEKILVTCRIPKEGLNELFKRFDVTYPEQEKMTYDEVLSVISEYDGILSVSVKIDKAVMEAGKKLRIISNYGAGYDNVEVGSATSKGIMVTNIPDSVTEATAELSLALMLAVVRRVAELDRKLREGNTLQWGVMNNLGSTLYGKNLGIVGMGRIGKAVARRAKACGMRILYHNRKKMNPDQEAETGASFAEMDELLRSSDVVSIHAPLTPETRHLIGERELSLMKPSAYIVNTSRGAVIDEAALVKALQTQRIAGAGLDVFEKEPVISPELLKMDNVVLLPHTGSGNYETRILMARDASQHLMDYFAGKRPKNVVNPELL